MKMRYILSVCLLCFALLASPGITAAQSLPPITPSNANSTFERLFLNFSEDMGDHAWWQSQTLIDAAGGVHTTFYTASWTYYAYCPANCGVANNWSLVNMGSTGNLDSLSYPALAVNSAGNPRMLRYNDYTYIYAECDANCTQVGSWKEVIVPLNPINQNNYPRGVNYFALDSQNRPRFVTYYYNGLTYAYCDTACTNAANWNYTDLELGTALGGAQLALNGNGQPRVIGINDNNSDLEYLQCNQGCAQVANWTRTKIGSDLGGFISTPTFSLRLDSQGRPRVVYYRHYQSDKNLYYAWSNANFTTPSSWSTDTLTLPPAGDRTVDMALDNQGRPHIAFASENYDLRYIYCTAACDSFDSQWTIQDIETGDDLDASDYIPPISGAWGSGWWLDGYASLALDANGNPYVSYFARNVQYVNTSTINHAWAIRFATTGKGSALKYATYLPLTRK